MREAIGSAFIVNLILIFIGIISALLVASISYSKTYKVKDRIIYIIEKYDGYTTCEPTQNCAETEINKTLASIGYNVVDGYSSRCEGLMRSRLGKDYRPEKLLHGANVGAGQYDYCVYEHEKNKFRYYTVISFMRFDVPLIGGLLVFPVSGETSNVYDPIDN